MSEVLPRGDGIALQALFVVQEQLYNGELVQLMRDCDTSRIPFYLIGMACKNLSPKLRVVIDFLVDRFASMTDLSTS